MQFLKQRLCSYSVWFLVVFWRLGVRPSLADYSGHLLGNSSPSQDISEAGLDLKCQMILINTFVHYNLFNLEVGMRAIILYSTRQVPKLR